MEIIGYKTIDIFFFAKKASLKRDLLLFDRLVINKETFDFWLSISEPIIKNTNTENYEAFKYALDEINFLADQNYIIFEKFDDNFAKSNNIINGSLLTFDEVFLNTQKENILKETDITKKENFLRLSLDVNLLCSSLSRQHCATLKLNDIINYQPIIDTWSHPSNIHYFNPLKIDNGILNSKKIDILNFVLKKTPIPANDVSWEEIFSYKKNDDIQLYRHGLSNWISEMSNSQLHPIEIEDKFDYLNRSYEDRLKKEKLKYNTGTFELIITTSLEVLENIAKLQLSAAAKTLFDIKKKNIDLLIEETQIPGREIAYISKLNETFNK